MKVVGWIMDIVGMAIIFSITDGFWLPFLGIMLISVGDGLMYGVD